MSTQTDKQDPVRETLEAAKQRHDRGYAQPWRPEPGDIIVGEFVDYQKNVKTQYGVSDVAEIKTDTGERKAVWLFHEVLADQWAEEEPSLGDRVGILYYGKTDPSKGGSSYHNYEVEVESSDQSEDEGPSDDSNPPRNGNASNDDLPF